MKQYTLKSFTRLLNKNSYYLTRTSGSHLIFTNIEGRHISIPHNIKSVVALRLIKENNLKE